MNENISLSGVKNSIEAVLVLSKLIVTPRINYQPITLSVFLFRLTLKVNLFFFNLTEKRRKKMH